MMQPIRYLDKLADELADDLARDRPMQKKVLRA